MSELAKSYDVALFETHVVKKLIEF
jgi:hypothetical protein